MAIELDNAIKTAAGSQLRDRWGVTEGYSFIAKKECNLIATRTQCTTRDHSTDRTVCLNVFEIYEPSASNKFFGTYNAKIIYQKIFAYNTSYQPGFGGGGGTWNPYFYFENPIRLSAGHKYAIIYDVASLYVGCATSQLAFNDELFQYEATHVYNHGEAIGNRTSIPAVNNTTGHNYIMGIDWLMEKFNYSYLVRDFKETKKIFVPTIDTDLILSQDNVGDWSLNKLQSNNTTSVSFPIFKDVKYNLTIPEGAKFCYAGTLDKKVSDFEDSETRVLNRILVDDATVTNPLELEFTALQNERGFVAYINDADAGLTPEQVSLTGTAGYELYKLTNEEGTEYEALPDFDITSEQFKNGSPLFVEPQVNVLMDFAHPSVLYWQEKADDNIALKVSLYGTPCSQHVTGDKISLEVDGVLCDIAEMQVDSEGGAILQFSFDDKQTWVYWKPENENDVNVGEWVTITEADRFNGQSKDVTDALSPANWKLAIGDADGFYIRASFISTSQALAKIGVKYSAREDATTTEVETEGTD